MGLFDRFRRAATEQAPEPAAMPELGPLVRTERVFRHGSGDYAARILERHSKRTVFDLSEVRSVSRADVLALIGSIEGSWQLAMELAAVEFELSKASNRELSRYLSETQYWYADRRDAYDNHSTPRYRDKDVSKWLGFEHQQEAILG